MLKVLVLGSGCKNCHTVQERAKQAVAEMGVDADVQLVTEMQTIMRYGVMQTPAIVINEKVVSTGRVPATSQIKQLLTAAAAQG
jgi:small redox-active disulfide protein 2